MENQEMTFEKTAEIAQRLHNTITEDLFESEKKRYTLDENFQQMSESQKSFFLGAIRESLYTGASNLLFIFDGATTCSDNQVLEADIVIGGEKTTFISDHFSGIQFSQEEAENKKRQNKP